MATYHAKSLTMTKNGDEYIIDPLQGNDAAFMDFTVNIDEEDWDLNSSLYTYVWQNQYLTQNSAIQTWFKDGVRDGIVCDIKVTKTTGQITFTMEEAPIGDVSILVRIMDTRVLGNTYPINADLISTNAVIGQTEVQGALEEIVSKIGAHDIDITVLANKQTSDENNIATVQNGLAYIVGNTNTTGSTLSKGQFVYVKGHSTIAEGLRTVTASISANGDITTNNTSACSEGGLNALNSNTAHIPESNKAVMVGANEATNVVYVQATKSNNEIRQIQGTDLEIAYLHYSGSWARDWTLYPKEMGNTVSSNLNTITSGRLQIFQYDSNTLNSPYKQDSSWGAAGIVFSYANESNYAVQVCFISGGGIAIRRKTNGSWGTWQLAFNPT